MDFNAFKTTYGSMHHHQDYNPHVLEDSVSISTLWKGAREITSGPLSLSNVGTPFLPVCLPFSILLQSFLFLGEILMVIYFDHDGDVYLSIDAEFFVGNVLVEAGESTTASSRGSQRPLCVGLSFNRLKMLAGREFSPAIETPRLENQSTVGVLVMVGELEQGQKTFRSRWRWSIGDSDLKLFLNLDALREWNQKDSEPWINHMQFLVSGLAGRNLAALMRLESLMLNLPAGWVLMSCRFWLLARAKGQGWKARDGKARGIPRFIFIYRI
jgi:hypothetical protein